MFLDLVEVKALPIVPAVGGVKNCFLTNAEYTHPENQNPRINLTVTQKEANGNEKVGYLTIWDPTYSSNSREEEQTKKDLKDATENLTHLVTTYTGKSVTQLREAITTAINAGRDANNIWGVFAQVMLEQLPANYKEIKTTWKISYNKKGNLILPKFAPFVALGDYTFKWNPQYDLLIAPATGDAKPDNNDTGTEVTDLF